jgi:hypothetical protein
MLWERATYWSFFPFSTYYIMFEASPAECQIYRFIKIHALILHYICIKQAFWFLSHLPFFRLYFFLFVIMCKISSHFDCSSHFCFIIDIVITVYFANLCKILKSFFSSIKI